MNYSGISISYPYVWLDIEASLPKVARLNWQQAIAVWEEGNNDPGEDAQQKVALTVFTIFNGRFLYVPRPSSSLPRWAESAREVLALNTIYHLNYFHFYIKLIYTSEQIACPWLPHPSRDVPRCARGRAGGVDSPSLICHSIHPSHLARLD